MGWKQAWTELRRPRGAAVVVGGCAVAFLLGGAAAKDGLFGAVMAAWIQAFGSVVAIAAAVWIDRGEARRTRETAAKVASDAESARLQAADNAAGTIARAARRVRALTDGDYAEEWERTNSSLRRAQKLVQLYIQPECSAHTADVLLLTDQTLHGLIIHAGAGGSLSDERSRERTAQALEAGATRIEGALEEHQHGIW